MKKHLLLIFSAFLFSNCSIGQEISSGNSFKQKKEYVITIMEKVADWQLAHPTGKKLWVWEYGTFYAGLMSYYKLNPQKKHFDAMIAMGNSLKWKLKPHPYLADNFTIAQTYLDLYEITKDFKMIDKTKYTMDMAFYKKPNKVDLRWKNNPHKLDWWSWCDALFMAPPAFSKMSRVTGEEKYLKEMDRLWKFTYSYLYDKEENLFFRDDSYFNSRTKRGKKVFWSRGNGWVVGGIVGVLKSMPEDYSGRKFYEDILRKMATRLLEIQSPEGFWYSSLLDKDEFNIKETSGTAFYCYALAWGVNNGLLEKDKFLTPILKAWKTLVDAVETDGKLGYVQLVGVGPDKVKREDTETYGTGAFLLAGTEVYRLINK
jgi:unsaturated rhamnogalacturonyl hydrolase